MWLDVSGWGFYKQQWDGRKIDLWKKICRWKFRFETHVVWDVVDGKLWSKHKWITIFYLHLKVCFSLIDQYCSQNHLFTFCLLIIRTSWLDGKHVVFGHVISGADVVKKVEKCGSKDGTTSQKVTIYACGELKWFHLFSKKNRKRFGFQKKIFIVLYLLYSLPVF